jgi:hypothetical protein
MPTLWADERSSELSIVPVANVPGRYVGAGTVPPIRSCTTKHHEATISLEWSL